MASDLMKDRFKEIERLALAAGLRPYDVQFFEVPTSVIYEVASYGLPTRYSHWSFGKCVTGDTYIYTQEGMKKIEDVIESLDFDFSENEFIPHKMNIYNDNDVVSTSHVYKSKASCLKIQTDKGICLSGTYEHPVLCLKDGKTQWVKMEDLAPGDCVLARLGAKTFANVDDLNFCFKKHPYKILHNQQYKSVSIPDKMSEDLAFLCGVLSAERGMTTPYGFTISINKAEKEFRQEIESRFRKIFDIESVDISRETEGRVLAYYSTVLRRFFEYLGIDYSSCCNKQIPARILSSSSKCWCRYLSGLFEGDGNVNVNSVEIALCCEEIIKQVQLMLLNLGIVSTTRFDILVIPGKSSVVKKETYKHRLWITGNKNLEKFKELIGFVSFDKKRKIEYACRSRKIKKYDTRIYSEVKSVVRNLYKQCNIRKSDNELQFAYQNALCYNPTGDSLEKIINKSESNLDTKLLSDVLNYLPLVVTKIADVGSQTVYDFTIPEGHKFLTNGIVSHNTYQHQKSEGEMGHSKIYELILNNNPSYAFLDTTNTNTINLMICAHCLAHADVFANNVMFKNASEENMIQVAKRHAEMIDGYRRDYGDDEVDEWLDIALALERHIDVFKKLKRARYPERHIEFKERTIGEFEDLVPNKEPLIKKVVEGAHLPPYPEKDLVWFLSEYSNLEEWQRRIFEIVRRESYYFYAQYRTKILNEGYASYWHAELMHQYFLGNDNDYGATGIDHPLTSEEHLDFLTSHEKVVQPGLKMHLKVEQQELDAYNRPTGRVVKSWNPRITENPHLFYYATRINPYYVGFRMFRDIKDRWDEYHEQGHMEDEWGTKIPVTMTGAEKIREVMESEDDVSFFRNYLTEELCDKLHLFAYGSTDEFKDDYKTQEDIIKSKSSVADQLKKNQTVQVRTKNVKDVISTMARTRNNYGVPCIVVRRVDSDGTLRLEHLQDDQTNIDVRYGEQTLRYIFRVWGRPVELIRKNSDHTHLMKMDANGFVIDHATSDYPECIEDKDSASSW